ncbi:MAG: hypothetical protein IH594_14370 [Bacteroidales bacterium]|nr:hypothetical protein [Bacteroidales bacterium]
MKISRLLVLLVIMTTGYGIHAQDCRFYFPEETGAVREMTSYDKKDKVTGKVRQTILEKKATGSDLMLKVENVIFDDKDAEVSRSEIELGCSNGVFKIDMSEYMSEMLQAYQTMEVELQGDNLQFPSSLSVGDALPEGNMNIKVRSNGIQVVNMDVNISNRKVEAQEKLSTPAGTFDCYKITFVTTAKTKLITVQTQGVEWIAEKVGVVKSESYAKNGKLNSYTLLTRLER